MNRIPWFASLGLILAASLGASASARASGVTSDAIQDPAAVISSFAPTVNVPPSIAPTANPSPPAASDSQNTDAAPSPPAALDAQLTPNAVFNSQGSGSGSVRRTSQGSTGTSIESHDTPATIGDPRRFPLVGSWTDGLQLESEDGKYHFHFGGVGQIDSVWYIGPASAFNNAGGSASTVQNSSATLVRRAILQADGDLLQQFDYCIQFDFANASNDNDGEQSPTFGNLTSSPTPLNVWVQVRDVPILGYVRVGNQTKPIGMENNTSATDLPFMERSDNDDAFYGPFDNGFSLGITAWNWTPNERVTWRYGIFRPATNAFGVALNKYTLGARLTALPLYADDGRELVHLGLGYWGGEIVQDELRDRARVLLRNAPGFTVPILVDTTEISGSQQYTIAPEFALVLGSFTLQAEYAGQFLTDATPDGTNIGTVFYHGGYAEALYFLTGEYQPYDMRGGVFGTVIPNHDYHLKKGDCDHAWGAWQVGLRFGWLDLNDKSIQGGEVYDWTAGVNWFLDANVKVQFNWIAEHHDAPGVTPGWINGAGVRVAFNF
jgi:phosphate-selective porin OprO and OprP